MSLDRSVRGGRRADWLVGIGFCHDHALILYVYLANGDQGVEESVLTVRTESIASWYLLNPTLILRWNSITLPRTARDKPSFSDTKSAYIGHIAVYSIR